MATNAHYEVRWGDARGNSMSLDLPPLDEDLVVAIARGIRDWWYKDAPNWGKTPRFVRLIKVENLEQVTPIDIPPDGRIQRVGRRTE